MGLVEAVAALLGAIAALITTLAWLLKHINKQREEDIIAERQQREEAQAEERKRVNELISELRDDQTAEKATHAETRRILEGSQTEVRRLKREVDVLCRKIEQLQDFKAEAEEQLERKAAYIQKLERDLHGIREDNVRLAGQNRMLTEHISALRSALMLIGIKLRESEDGAGLQAVTDRAISSEGLPDE